MTGREKEAILCKIEPTLSRTSPGASTKDSVALGLEELGATWTT